MRNPFRRNRDVEKQLATLREIAATMQDAADQMRIETSAPMLRQNWRSLTRDYWT